MSVEPILTRRYEAADATVLELHGCLVAGNVLRLEPLFARLLLQLHHPLVVDLTGVDSADHTGAMLLLVAARAAHADSPVRLAAPNATLQAVLRSVGALREVTSYHTVDGAVRGDAVDRVVDVPPTR